ncbi:helix-turn-helix domain-containing protein [Acidithiobacillus sp. IBUN Pt1247-S3]|uniref:helix-turn-helix domain-containing protein n=1 Tax=Acidithiobacillus sp. IBUN Pt1247-S3 TaxID=3166642 RepID=UPI0034E3B723
MGLLTTSEAAVMLGISQSWLEKDRSLYGRVPFIKIGRRVRYDKDDIERFIKHHRFSSTSEISAATSGGK